MSTEPSDDEVLVTKWLLLGGVLWAPPNSRKIGRHSWFAIEPGHDENDFCCSQNAFTPAGAIRKYIKRFHEEQSWLAPLLEHVRSTTSSDRGPT